MKAFKKMHKNINKFPLSDFRQWINKETLIHSLPYIIAGYIGDKMS